MIKAIAEDTLILAISEENVRMMRGGLPICIDLNKMGNPKFTKILIDLSPTMAEAQKKLEPFIGPNTHVHGMEN